MPERSHLSIGEVLSLLRDEFPDVTISKIRFLESQGLVDPERTPSGYRKFYEHDVERLRWILRQQREHFLPLKVIRGRLTEQEGGEEDDIALVHESSPPATQSSEVEEAAADTHASWAGVATAAENRPGHGHEGDRSPGRGNGPGRSAPPTPSLFAALRAGQPEAEPEEPAGRAGNETTGAGPSEPAAKPPAPKPPAPKLSAGHSSEAGRSGGYDHEPETYTVEELASATGTESTLVQELKQYGLIIPQAVVGGVAYYDAASLQIVRAAAQFARHGVEARHLRPWRNAADREADLFQQVVLPLLRQRNPQARHQALETLSELSSAGAELRAALVERAVREIR